MRPAIAVLLSSLLASGAYAAKSNTPDQITDPDLLKEMRDARESNLSNAMARSRDDASESARHLASLMMAGEAGVRAAVQDLKGMVTSAVKPGSLEEDADDLHLCAQMLAQKQRAFRNAARGLSLTLPKADPQALIPLRASYPSRDRSRDLQKSSRMLEKAREKTGKIELEKSQRRLAEAARSFYGEMKNAAEILSRVFGRVSNMRRSRPEFAVAEKRIEVYAARAKKDSEDLEIESKMMENALMMTQHDEKAFDQGF